MPTGQGQRQFHTLGMALFPTPQVVLKIDYQFALDNAPDSPRADHLLGRGRFLFLESRSNPLRYGPTSALDLARRDQRHGAAALLRGAIPDVSGRAEIVLSRLRSIRTGAR